MAKTFSGRMEFDQDVNLWVSRASDQLAQDVRTTPFRRGILKRKAQVRTIYDPYGKPVCQVRLNDVGSAEHEFDNHQDAVARPLPIEMKLFGK